MLHVQEISSVDDELKSLNQAIEDNVERLSLESKVLFDGGATWFISILIIFSVCRDLEKSINKRKLLSTILS